MTKYVFITGGVVSSLGKGLTASAIGALLEATGFQVNFLKCDPYLNIDPGTMSPFQHGEVYVLQDGTETDLDLGHYERFTQKSQLTAQNSITSGKIYSAILEKERRGDFLGQTVQVVPHVTNEIKSVIKNAGSNCDILITELGGTIGDIEGLPFLEAMRQLALELGHQNVLFIHLTLLPYIKAAGELKTKPSQQSVAKLREIGIIPDILICRTEHSISDDLKQKLSLFCNVPLNAVIEEKDVDTSIYELPSILHKQGVHELITQKLHLKPKSTQTLQKWKKIVEILVHPKHSVRIGVVGKYMDLHDAYKSVYESLIHAGIANNCAVDYIKIDSELIQKHGPDKYLKNLDGILVPGGFGNRGIEGKIAAAQFARENNIPYFGICLGMQIAVIEFARHVAGLDDANSTEFKPKTPNPVIALMEEQKKVKVKGASMRLGTYDCDLAPNSLAHKAYQQDSIQERHRHRWEFNNKYRKKLETFGLIISGINPSKNLVEIIELPNHPWFLGVQFHPEFQSKPLQPHPLFTNFIKASISSKK